MRLPGRFALLRYFETSAPFFQKIANDFQTYYGSSQFPLMPN